MMSARDNFVLVSHDTPFYRRTCIPLCYWSPTPVHPLAIGDSCWHWLGLSLPHFAEISAFCHALRRQLCVVAIRHVSDEREFLLPRLSDISNLALAELVSCYRSPHLLKVGACGLAPSLNACSSQTSIFFNLQSVLLFYQSLQRYATCAIHQSTRPAHRSLVYSDRHLYSVYFERIGGRSVAHTNIHPKTVSGFTRL